MAAKLLMQAVLPSAVGSRARKLTLTVISSSFQRRARLAAVTRFWVNNAVGPRLQIHHATSRTTTWGYYPSATRAMQVSSTREHVGTSAAVSTIEENGCDQMESPTLDPQVRQVVELNVYSYLAVEQTATLVLSVFFPHTPL